MKLVIFGLSISSSRGNGHATIWRGLRRALACRGRQIVFYERDVPYYSARRDLTEIPGGEIAFYSDWEFARRPPASERAAFYCSSKLTLNVARRATAEMGDCPSGRIFEAAVCGSPILGDRREGLDQFFTPGEEILSGRPARLPRGDQNIE
jgi:spore maturation protein CgeB